LQEVGGAAQRCWKQAPAQQSLFCWQAPPSGEQPSRGAQRPAAH
jgi:hypothetical protein